MGRRAVVLVVAAAAVLAACSGGRDTGVATSTSHRTLVVNDEPTALCVAVAGTLAEKVNGLSNRPSLPPREGMAFPFADPGARSFNMKDTSFPLAIVWVSADSRVLGSTTMAADSTDHFQSPGDITLAVELSPQDWAPLAGTARTLVLGQECNGTITAGRPGQPKTQF